MRDYYTVDEVAYLYGVSKELVFKWIRSGELEAEMIPDAMEEERYYSGRKMDTTYHGYVIHPKTLDNFRPNISYRGVQLLNAKTFAFWDGKSRGTKNMIDWAKSYGLEIHVVRYEN